MGKFDHWRLFSDRGRQVWEWTADFEKTLCGDLRTDVEAWLAQEPQFNKRIQPHPADRALRPAAEPPPPSERVPTLEEALRRGICFFGSLQCDDGHWPGDYGGPLFLLPGLVIVAHCCQFSLPYPMRVLMAAYMVAQQNDDGGWGLHIESPSTMFGTGMQYVALRMLGFPPEDPRLQKARRWINAHGGITAIPSWGKFYLAVAGLFDWRGINPLLPELWLLPRWVPLHPARIWCHARMVYLPMGYLYGRRFTAPVTELTEALREELYPQGFHNVPWRRVRYQCCPADLYHTPSLILKLANTLMRAYERLCLKRLRQKALDFAYRYIQAEDLQTQWIDIGPVNKVLNMLSVYATEGPDSEAFQRHAERLRDYLWLAEDGLKMNGYNGSQLWDTAFASRALAASKHPEAVPFLRRSFHYLDLSQVQQEVPLQKEFFRHPSVGGWPFSTLAHGWPITDCTAEALHAVLAILQFPSLTGTLALPPERLYQAVDLILSFQNRDGGWATYERTRGPRWLERFNPSEVFSAIMIDYSYTECSSSCIQALCAFHRAFPAYRSADIRRAIHRGVRFILGQANPEGLWYGSWGVCFTYGTWFASQALRQADPFLTEKVRQQAHLALEKLSQALQVRQQPDGGWGEHYSSCLQRTWVPATSQVVQTAWAVMALMNTPRPPQSAIQRGLHFLMRMQAPHGDWPQQNISGVFNKTCMITYANYRNIFPLWALGRARQEGFIPSESV